MSRKIVIKNRKGKELKVVYDVPCDTCTNRNRCKNERLTCKAFTEYYNFGWYDIYKVAKKLRPMR